jgi:Tfp pilus assembly protein PilO
MTARDRTLILALAGLAVLAGFWFAVLRPKRTEAKALGVDIAAQRQRLQTAEQTVAQGVKAKADYADNYGTLLELGKAVPADDDIPSLVYQLDVASHGADVEFQSLVRSAAQAPAASTSSSAGSASSSTSSSSGSTSSSGSASPAPGTAAATGGSTGSTAPGAATGAAATATASLPPGATVGTAGLATLPFTFTFKGSYLDLQRFIAGLQGFVREDDGSVAVRGRLLTIDGVSLTLGTKDLSHLEAKVVATAYLSPAAADPATGTASGAPGSPPAGTSVQTSSAITTGTS